MEYKIDWSGKSLPSKKNSKQLRINRKTGKRFIASSDNYQEWEELFICEIRSLKFKLGKVKSATYTFYAPNKRKWDLSNKVESINDGLVKALFLEDDNYECIPEITLKFGGIEKEWRVEMLFIV